MSQPQQPAQETNTPAAPAPQGTGRGTAPPARGQNPGRGRGRGGRGGATNTPAPAEPAVIPAPGDQKVKNPSPTKNSSVPTFSGWGTPNVQMERRQVRREFTPSAAPFVDLVYSEYDLLVAQHQREASRLPRSLFLYLCALGWWNRVLHLKMQNFRLTPSEREAMRTLDTLEISLPDRISQYLKGMGNFVTNGERFEAMWEDHDFSANSGQANPLALGGFYNTPAGRVVNATTMWLYAHVPVPGVLMSTITNEFMQSVGAPANVRQDLRGIRPPVASVPGATHVTESRNILFYERDSLTPLHSSWKDTFRRLGYTQATAANQLTLPPGTISHWLIHPESLRYTSDTLLSIGGVKMSPLRDINRVKDGAYFQIGYVEQPEYMVGEVANPHLRNEFKATYHLQTWFVSFNPVMPAHLGPAMGCSYRYWIRFGTINNVAGVTPSSPWFFTLNNVLVTLPIRSRTAANAMFSRLPLEYAAHVYQTGHVRREELLHSILQ